MNTAGLNLFPPRVPIGEFTFQDKSGEEQKQTVLMTVEFWRALTQVFERIGGANGMGSDDFANYLAQSSAAMELLQAEVASLRQQLQDTQLLLLERAPAAPDTGGLEHLAIDPPLPTDWEHPGKLGEKKPNTGRITILNVDPANAGVVGFPSLYFSTDTTSGLYRPAANQLAMSFAGANVVTWSAAGAAYVQNVSTTKQFVSALATGTPPLVVASATQVANLYASRAALADTATELTNPTTFSAPATDPASTQTLVNELRAAAVAKKL